MKSFTFSFLAFGLVALAPAQINSVVIHERVFNDDSDSTLVTTSTYPTLVQFNDSMLDGDGTGSEFANRHVFNLSSDGVNDFAFTNDTFFDLKMDVSLTSFPGSTKEAGFLIDTTVGGQGQFIVKNDGEIAVFGGPMPFHQFQPAGSSLPATITLGMRYFMEGGVRKVTYMAGASTHTAEFTNLEQGIIGGKIGGYAQFAIIAGNQQNFGDAKFENITYEAVPEPASLLALSVGAVALLRRRRR